MAEPKCTIVFTANASLTAAIDAYVLTTGEPRASFLRAAVVDKLGLDELRGGIYADRGRPLGDRARPHADLGLPPSLQGKTQPGPKSS